VSKLKIKKILIITLAIVIALILIINLVVSNIIEQKISDFLLKENSKLYTANIKGVKFKLLKRSIVIDSLSLSPTSESILNLKKQKSTTKSLEKITISSIKLEGIHIFKIIFNNNILINQLQLNDVLIQKLKNKKIKEPKKTSKSNFDIDSIYIKNINGIELDEIKVSNLIYQVTELSSNEIVFQNSPLNFDITGFKLENIDNNYFKLKPVNDKFEINNIKIDFPDKKYTFSVDSALVNFEKNIVNIKKLSYKPMIDKVALANSYSYNTEVYNLNIDEINLHNFDFSKMIENKGVFMDSLSISKLNMEIYKDKRKPFNLKKRPLLLHLKLKQMKFPLKINKIKISDSKLFYIEHLEKKDVLLEVSMSELNVQINNVTSIKEYREKPLKVFLHSKFLNASNLIFNMELPLKDGQNTFYFNGSLGASKFSYFDTVIFPALGLKNLKGNLNSLIFSASADNVSSKGKMTLLYHGLEAEVFKSHSFEENKFLSWTVNTIVHKSNPGKNNKIREAVLSVDRTIYKGLFNYIWKTLESGIINTLVPGGKTSKKVNAKKERKLKREKRKTKK
jgi:hypothetical protein